MNQEPRRARALGCKLLQRSDDACLMGTILAQVFLNKIKFSKEINAFLLSSQKSHTKNLTFAEQAFLSCNCRVRYEKTLRQLRAYPGKQA
jgi:hypothetical protein